MLANSKNFFFCQLICMYLNKQLKFPWQVELSPNILCISWLHFLPFKLAKNFNCTTTACRIIEKMRLSQKCDDLFGRMTQTWHDPREHFILSCDRFLLSRVYSGIFRNSLVQTVCQSNIYHHSYIQHQIVLCWKPSIYPPTKKFTCSWKIECCIKYCYKWLWMEP